MALTLQERNGGKIVEVNVSGKLTKEDYLGFVPEVERLIKLYGKIRVAVDMTDFHGWEAGALWEDIKFDVKHFADIERIAMIGESKWQKNMARFCVPFTRAKIRYFTHEQKVDAQGWLEGSSDAQPKLAA